MIFKGIFKAAAQDSGGTAAAPRTYPKQFKVRFGLNASAEGDSFIAAKDCILVLEFHCHDLLQIMQEGLFWNTSNVVPARGWIGRTSPTCPYFQIPDWQHLSQTHGWQRVWELSESVGRPEPECRWVATATLLGHSVEAMADFRFGTICRQKLSSCCALDKDGRYVFSYARPSCTSCLNFNCFVDELHPKYGSWWFWPMEGTLDDDTDGASHRPDQDKPPPYTKSEPSEDLTLPRQDPNSGTLEPYPGKAGVLG